MDKTFFWYLERFKKMPLKEIPYRLNHFLRKQKDKFFPPALPPINSILDGMIGDICNSINFVYEEEWLSLFDQDVIVQEADCIVRHEFDVFGIRKNFGSPINFHLDPKTGNIWPLQFWNDIDYRDGKTIGGIKFAWELNRLHHWPQLALAFVLTRNKIYFDEFFYQLKSWLESNPYPYGINWISGIEIGIRLVNLFYSLKIIGRDDLGNELCDCIQKFVYLHACHLYRYPSKYSSCGNHALAEALGLFIAGTAFPSFKDATKWKAFGKLVLEREIVRQIYPDGSSFEHSTTYLHSVADYYLIYYLLCGEYCQPCGKNIGLFLERIFTFIASLVDYQGNFPLIGDDDDGYVLKLWFGEQNNYLSLLNTGSLLFKRPDWVHPISSLDIKTCVLIGQQVNAEWKHLCLNQSWDSRSFCFKDAGISVFAEKIPGNDIKLIFNHGPLGALPASAHGHADALSFWLTVNGEPIIVDPGTYLYQSGGKWRTYFRSTAAHNTIEIDGRDQAVQVADFMFGDFYHVHSDGLAENDDVIVCQAWHDGYRRLSDPTVHNRKITFEKRTLFISIHDVIKCSRNHLVKLLFHLHPAIIVEEEENNAFKLLSATCTLRLSIDSQLHCQMIKGHTGSLMGWYSPRFNSLEKTTSLVCVCEIKRSKEFWCGINIV